MTMKLKTGLGALMAYWGIGDRARGRCCRCHGHMDHGGGDRCGQWFSDDPCSSLKGREALSGSYKGQLGEAQVAGTVKGDEVSMIEYTVAGQGQSITVKYSALWSQTDGKTMSGKVSLGQLGEGYVYRHQSSDERGAGPLAPAHSIAYVRQPAC